MVEAQVLHYPALIADSAALAAGATLVLGNIAASLKVSSKVRRLNYTREEMRAYLDKMEGMCVTLSPVIRAARFLYRI